MKNDRLIALGIFVTALLIRLVFGLVQLSRGFLFVSEGDYTLYEIGAAHFLANGDFNNSIFLVRPPLFSLLIALTGNHYPTLIILNSVFGALLVPMTWLLARQLGLSATVALLAGVFVAVDPISIRYTAFLGPEALSFVGALAMMNALVALLNSRSQGSAIAYGVVAAVALWVSAFARPSIYLIWTGMSLWLLTQRPRLVVAIALYAVLSFSGVRLWQQHNLAQFNNPTFSAVGPYTMTYYRAASVLRFGEGLSPDDAYLEINRRMRTALGQDPTTATLDDTHSYLAAPPEVATALNDISINIFLDYPLIYLATLALGAARYFYVVPSFPPFENFLNPLNYITPLWNLLLLVMALMGAWFAFRARRWHLLAVVILFGGYFTAGTLLVKSAGLSGRERTVIFPMIALAAAYGIVQVYQRRWGVASIAENHATEPPS